MKRNYKILLYVAAGLMVANLAIVLTGNAYLYRALWYNFAGIDDNRIFPSAPIPAGMPSPWPLSAEYNRMPLPAKLRQELEARESIAFLVIRHDSIIQEQYWEGYKDTSLSNSFSMAKTFVGILIGCAMEEGTIKSLDQPVGDFLPWWKEGRRREVTIRHLITMSSGINWDESYANPFSVTTKAYYGSDLEPVLKGIDVTGAPGEFRYLSGNTLLLSAVLQKATGKPLSEYFSEKIWKRIGAEVPAEWSLDQEGGIEKSYCCVYSNARDFARIGRLYLDSGRYNGVQVVPASFVKESIAPASFKGPSGFYGYSWWLLPGYKGRNIFYARGILGQYIIAIPEENIIIVRLGRKRGERQEYHYSDLYAYIDGALEMYGRKN
jgi:CubicO group peptidase (beta-lactamase class C family)